MNISGRKCYLFGGLALDKMQYMNDLYVLGEFK